MNLLAANAIPFLRSALLNLKWTGVDKHIVLTFITFFFISKCIYMYSCTACVSVPEAVNLKRCQKLRLEI